MKKIKEKDLFDLYKEFDYLMDHMVSFEVSGKIKDDLKDLIELCSKVYYENIELESLLDDIYYDIGRKMGYSYED